MHSLRPSWVKVRKALSEQIWSAFRPQAEVTAWRSRFGCGPATDLGSQITAILLPT